MKLVSQYSTQQFPTFLNNSVDPELQKKAISPDEAAAWDQHLQASLLTSGWTLMQRAATQIAKLVRAMNPREMTVFVCGPGNNGADGLVAATFLAKQKRAVKVVSPCLGPSPQSLFSKSLKAAARENVEVEWNFKASKLEALQPGLWVDALLGIGQSRPLQGNLLETVNRLQTHSSPILSVDCPTGLDGETGKSIPIAVTAAQTLTFFAPKQGFFTADGPRHCGKITVSHLGTDPAALKGWLSAHRK